MSRSDNRTEILDTALRLSGEKEIDAVSTAALCRAAGVSNGSFFHYFPTKDALQTALYCRALGRYQNAIANALERSKSARQGVRGVVLNHVRWVLANPAEARFLHWGRHSGTGGVATAEIDACNRIFFARVIEWLRPHTKAGIIRKLRLEVLSALVFGPVYLLTRDWMRGGDGSRLRAVAPLLADAAWAAVAADPKKGRSR